MTTLDLSGRIEAAAVPLYLMTAGLLILAGDYGGPGVRRTWPILLILFGALRMAAYWARRAGEDDGDQT